MTGIKICGLFRECDIDFVNEAGPDYIGFVLNFPKSHRNVTVMQAASFKKKLSHKIRAVGVFVDQPSETVIQAAREIPLDVIQLHGNEGDPYIEVVREKTGLPVWKAFRIRRAEDLETAAASKADEILLDGGYGTGVAFDWSLLKGFPRSFILAGGLTPENIPQAIRQIGPAVIDISTGVETDQVKDYQKIKAAVRAAHGGTA